MTVYFFDLITLELKFPDLYREMNEGCFTFQKSERRFSMMAVDQVHEQNNRIIKEAGGAANFLNLNDESALVRWETTGAELALRVGSFEENLPQANSSDHAKSKHHHHEESPAFQKRFDSDVKTMYNAMHQNPFEYEKAAKFNDSNQIVDDTVVNDFKLAQSLGTKQYTLFLQDRLIYSKTPVSDPLINNNLWFWDVPDPVKKMNFNPSTMVSNKLRAAISHRQQLSEKLFTNELYNVPPYFALTSTSLYHVTKSEFQKKFSGFTSQRVEGANTSSSSVIIIEMSPIIKAAAAGLSSEVETFSDFAFLLYARVLKISANHDQIHLVFDRYFEGSLKSGTR